MENIQEEYTRRLLNLQKAFVEFMEVALPEALQDSIKNQMIVGQMMNMINNMELTGLSPASVPVVSDKLVGIVNPSGAEKTSHETVVPSQPQQAQKRLVGSYYATTPISKGEYMIFKRMSEERTNDKFFQIDRFDDGSCEFLLLDKHDDSEALQSLKDNADRVLNAAVVICHGEIMGNCQVTIIEKGKGHMEGRNMIIDAPASVNFSTPNE